MGGAKRSAVLIRSHVVGAAESRLRSVLAGHFGAEHVHLVLENIAGPAATPAAGCVVLDGDFLRAHGLAAFPSAGWQCGDYFYYAAALALPHYDFFWLVERDVAFGMGQCGAFFEACDAADTDLLGPRFTERGPEWHWYASVQAWSPGPVHGPLFPVTRLSRRAILHLLLQRAAYCASEPARRAIAGGRAGTDFINDEAFCGTVLMRDGFSCGKVEALLPRRLLTRDTFSTHLPILQEETLVPRRAGWVFHPVCRPLRARQRFAAALQHDPAGVARRMRAVVQRFGATQWQAWSGLSVAEVEACQPAGRTSPGEPAR